MQQQHIITDGPPVAEYNPTSAVDRFCGEKVRRPNQSQRKAYKPRPKKTNEPPEFVERFWAGDLSSSDDNDDDV